MVCAEPWEFITHIRNGQWKRGNERRSSVINYLGSSKKYTHTIFLWIIFFFHLVWLGSDDSTFETMTNAKIHILFIQCICKMSMHDFLFSLRIFFFTRNFAICECVTCHRRRLPLPPSLLISGKFFISISILFYKCNEWEKQNNSMETYTFEQKPPNLICLLTAKIR